jgi:hypothetical protein
MNKDHLDPSVDLRTDQLYGEGTVRTAQPWIHPHVHLPSVEWLDVATDEGPRPSTHLVAAAGRLHAGVVACGCVSEPHRIPIWVEGRGGYP